MKKLALLLLAAFFATAVASVPFVASTSTAEARGKSMKKNARAKKSMKRSARRSRSVKRSRSSSRSRAAKRSRASGKSCGTFMYRKGGKCTDARNKK